MFPLNTKAENAKEGKRASPQTLQQRGPGALAPVFLPHVALRLELKKSRGGRA